jgi:hypothetical protein
MVKPVPLGISLRYAPTRDDIAPVGCATLVLSNPNIEGIPQIDEMLRTTYHQKHCRHGAFYITLSMYIDICIYIYASLSQNRAWFRASVVAKRKPRGKVSKRESGARPLGSLDADSS